MPTIYLDMDGVVANWDLAAEQYIGRPRRPDPHDPDAEHRWAHQDWLKIRGNQRFFSDLPLMPGALELADQAREFRDYLGWELMFLTAIPRHNDCPWAFHDKMTWANRHFPDIPVHFGPYSHDKQTHCRPGDVLVDDRTSNILEWRAQGGTAIQVLQGSVWPAIEDLGALFQERSGAQKIF